MRVALAGIALTLAACAETTPPERPRAYDFVIRSAGGFPLTFHWPAPSLPVRIWAEEAMDLPVLAHEALRTWEGAMLYGEFTGTAVAESASADVIIRAGSPFVAVSPNPLDCSGATTIEVALDTAIGLPFRITLSPRVGAASGSVAACLALVTTHELGHALGLFLHSDDPADLMHGRPSRADLSPRDLATFGVLYHTPPTVRLPAGR